MTKRRFRKGDHVTWNAEAGRVPASTGVCKSVTAIGA
jgi:hypothetical protein